MILKQNRYFGILLAAFVGLALIYMWATPPFEASDELWHFGTIQYIADTGELPVQVIGVETIWEQEGSQPPLYYLLAAAVVRGIDRNDFDTLRQPNPHAQPGQPGVVGNKNLVLHASPHPEWQGTNLAVYILRLLSIALGIVTVSAVYAAARLLQPDAPNVALLAAGLTAFNPMFLFITASVNNDNLVTALNSVVIWQISVLLRDGFSVRRSVFVAVLIALAALSKLSGLVLVPALGLAALWTVYRTRNWLGLFVLGALVASAWALIAGWWYLRNITLYGELFGTTMMAQVAGVRETPFTFSTLLAEFEGFRVAYWGWFGAVNILTHPIFYVIMDVVTVAGVVGLLVHVWRNRFNDSLIIRIVINTLIVGGGMVAVVAWTAQTYASQGRLLFPYVAAISSLLALGLITLYRRTALLAAPLAVFATLVPFVYITPAYSPSSLMSRMPETANQVYARFGNIALVGYETPLKLYEPGDSVPITVYWQVSQSETQDLSLWLHAVGADGEVIGKVDSYPGSGRLRTSTWQRGIYADTYTIPLEEDATGQYRLRIQVGWWDYATQVGVEPMNAAGEPLPSVMLDAGALVSPQSNELDPVNITPLSETVNFGSVIALKGYNLTDNQLTLVWEATGTPADDYTVFAQILSTTDSDNPVKGQGDAPPALPTRYWRAGEQYTTQHTINYPEALQVGTYRLVVGWYRPGDFVRLDTNHPDDAYTIETFEVSE